MFVVVSLDFSMVGLSNPKEMPGQTSFSHLNAKRNGSFLLFTWDFDWGKSTHSNMSQEEATSQDTSLT